MEIWNERLEEAKQTAKGTKFGQPPNESTISSLRNFSSVKEVQKMCTTDGTLEAGISQSSVCEQGRGNRAVSKF